MNKLEQKLSRIDLNLLVALSVLLNERSVSKAAIALYVSQPAMSKTLQRLRDLFEDPLFYRTSTGIMPTSRACELENILPNILSNINAIFKHKTFDPLTCEQVFSISIPSILCHSLLLPFVQNLSVSAPNICIIDLPVEIDHFTGLDNGDYDFSIHIDQSTSNNFTSTSLGYIRPVVYARKSHPLNLLKKSVSLSDLEKYKFIYYNVGTEENGGVETPAEKICKRANFQPNIVVKSSQMSMLTTLLSTNDYLLIAPSILLNSPDFYNEFVAIFEFEEEEKMELLLSESLRIKNSLAEQWIKKELLKSMSLVY